MFIVLDGIDGAGKGRQRLELCKYLKNRVKELYTIDFPNHKSPIYKHLIHPALHEEIKLNSSSWLYSFMLDQLLMADEINRAVKSKDVHFVVDGYFTTTIAYQCLMNKYFSLKQMEVLANIVKMPKPDIAIYIDVDPVTAIKRKEKEQGHDEGMDIFERSINNQIALRKAFKRMVKEAVFCRWKEVDGMGSINEVTDQIVKVLNKFIK